MPKSIFDDFYENEAMEKTEKIVPKIYNINDKQRIYSNVAENYITSKTDDLENRIDLLTNDLENEIKIFKEELDSEKNKTKKMNILMIFLIVIFVILLIFVCCKFC